MDNVIIEKTKYTPYINFNVNKALLVIEGRSYPENTFKFYHPLIDWIKEYLETSKGDLIFSFNLSYFNSSSAKVLFDIFDLLEQSGRTKNELLIKWLYAKDNEISKEAGEDFIEDFEKLKIELVEISE